MMPMWREYRCQLCFATFTVKDIALSGRITCAQCSSWQRYWDGLTDAERTAELIAMAEYAVESDG